MAATVTGLEPAQYLTFFIADEEYAVGILKVKEIIEFDTLTRLPSAPRHIRGVINLRGSVVPVVDLAVCFGLPERPVTRRTCIVIVEVRFGEDQVVMGIIADAVSQVIDLAPDDIEPPPPFGTRVAMEHLLGMGKVGRKFALILDIDRALSEPDRLAVAHATRATSGDADPALERPA